MAVSAGGAPLEWEEQMTRAGQECFLQGREVAGFPLHSNTVKIERASTVSLEVQLPTCEVYMSAQGSFEVCRCSVTLQRPSLRIPNPQEQQATCPRGPI